MPESERFPSTCIGKGGKGEDRRRRGGESRRGEIKEPKHCDD